jgi:cbb3-type cytochrome oxidase subunit 1
MNEIALRVIVGGVVVSTFALLGDLLKPKSFAGLFGAAPSIALATLFLTASKDGREYASIEARSMILGAVAFFVYASVVSRLLIRRKLPVLRITVLSMTLWFGCAFGLWFALLR